MRPRQVHVDRAEATVRRIYEIARPALAGAAGAATSSLWVDACIWAAATHNIRAGPYGIPHVRMFGAMPDLTNMLPFYCYVAAYDHDNKNRFDARAVVTRYIGPACGHGVGAIRALFGTGSERIVKAFRFVAPPGADFDSARLALHPSVPSPVPPGFEDVPPAVLAPPFTDVTSTHDTATGAAPPRRSMRSTKGRAAEVLDLNPDVPDGHWGGRTVSSLATATAIVNSPLIALCLVATASAEVDPFSAGSSSIYEPALVSALERSAHGSGTARDDYESIVALEGDVSQLHDLEAKARPPALAMSLNHVLRRFDSTEWIAAIDKERLDDATNFADGRPAFFKVLRSSVPPTAEVQKSLITSVYKRSGKRKPRWVVDGSRPAGLPTNPSSSSPTAIASTVHLVLAL
ncbi:hypothetical protein M885DRAFT_533308, partial [Pelagophyceae sp. CCMP2097]